MSALHTEHRGAFRWGCETVDDDGGVTIRTATAELPSGLTVERCDTSGGDGSDVTLVFVVDSAGEEIMLSPGQAAELAAALTELP